MRWPHDRAAQLWRNGEPTERLLASATRWCTAILADDGIDAPIADDGDRGRATVLARADGRLAGAAIVDHLLSTWAPGATWTWQVADGDTVATDQTLLEWQGTSSQLLALERPVLNLLGQLSGIATETAGWLGDLAELEATGRKPSLRRRPLAVACTRKTTWGLLDKWAVHLGGGLTHRLSRLDARMLKENDLAAMHPRLSPRDRVHEAVMTLRPDATGAFIEVEVRKLAEAVAAADAWCERRMEDPGLPRLVIMLDNLGPEGARDVIGELLDRNLCNHLVVEGSGGVSRASLTDWWRSGVDVISSSAVNRGTAPLDLSCLIEGA